MGLKFVLSAIVVLPVLSFILPPAPDTQMNNGAVSTAEELTELFRLNPTTAARGSNTIPGTLVSVHGSGGYGGWALQEGTADEDSVISTSWLSGHIPLGDDSVYSIDNGHGLSSHAFWVWNPNRVWKQIGIFHSGGCFGYVVRTDSCIICTGI